MGVIDMVFFRCFERTVFHPMPNTSDKHELIKTILYPIKRIHLSAQGWIVGGVLSCESRYALFSSKFRRNEDNTTKRKSVICVLLILMVIVLSLSVYAAYYSSNATGSAYASISYTSASISGGGNDCYLVCKFNHAIRDDDRKEWTGSGSNSISHTPTNVSANGNPDPVQSSRASAWDGEDEVAFDSWP